MPSNDENAKYYSHIHHTGENPFLSTLTANKLFLFYDNKLHLPVDEPDSLEIKLDSANDSEVINLLDQYEAEVINNDSINELSVAQDDDIDVVIQEVESIQKIEEDENVNESSIEFLKTEEESQGSSYSQTDEITGKEEVNQDSDIGNTSQEPIQEMDNNISIKQEEENLEIIKEEQAIVENWKEEEIEINLVQNNEGTDENNSIIKIQTKHKELAYKKKDKKFMKRNIHLLEKVSEFDGFNKWLLGQKTFKNNKIEKLNLLDKKARKHLEKAKLKGSIEDSVKQKDQVASEALAEILVSQGHFDKAIEMYQQLILTFPEKSSFFAARIENLKTQR